MISTILYILSKLSKKKKKKNYLEWTKNNSKIKLFYRHPRSSRAEFSNKLIASDLLLL